MKKFQKILVCVLTLALLMSFSNVIPALAAEKTFTVHAKAPSDWTNPNIWAWSAPDGTNVFETWPGKALNKDENNSGWYTYSLPTWVNSIIINGNKGTVQTVDATVKGKELWMTVTKKGSDGKYSVDVVYTAPSGFNTQAAATDKAETKAASNTSNKAASNTDTEKTESVPKTGEKSTAYLWVSLIAASGIGYLAVRRRKSVQ